MSDETATATAEEAAITPGDGDGGGSPGAGPWPTRRALVWLCAVFLVGALVLAGLAASLSSQLRAERNGREDAMRVAARMGSALLTYDHRDLDATRRAVFALATESFEQEYEEFFGGLQELYQRLQATSRVTDTEVFLSEVENGQASAVVRLVAQSDGLAGPRAQIAVVRLELVELDGGRWLVQGVKTIDFAEGQPAGEAPPTTAPGTE